MNTPAPVIEAVDAILRQSKLGEEYRKDFTKYVQGSYDAGVAVNCTHVHSVPLSEAEISAFREFARNR